MKNLKVIYATFYIITPTFFVCLCVVNTAPHTFRSRRTNTCPSPLFVHDLNLAPNVWPLLLQFASHCSVYS